MSIEVHQQGAIAGRVWLLGGLLLASSAWGCGNQKASWETVYPAKGVLTYRGKPVPNAEIALFPVDESFPDVVRPRAKTTDKGEFVVWTYQPGDGAPAGDYKATVVRNQVVEIRNVAVTKPNDLPPKYSKLQSTDLIIKISQNDTQIPPIELR